VNKHFREIYCLTYWMKCWSLFQTLTCITSQKFFILNCCENLKDFIHLKFIMERVKVIVHPLP